ncbi:DUF397 domain-containing protein [Amycolatopsis sp. PS_44_ISF1]|uniref:DUF397 domain-containing protein n=1 Tax=Amycolatopsis sp. PS_44_ISF1 TaxID=2974917 RepID=UPI0028E06F91|nr:DUF397 domain-containing protein [Amycolatopsis sp. PS_44_ISF1]MDT8914213.1 DUF397 domain-containing protein [Amycolatopsis sp. PS_44_ISF1]
MTPDAGLSGAQWRKSSYSGGGNDCVEIAFVDGGAAVRDSKEPEGGAFRLPASGWQGLLATVRAGGPSRG